MKERQEKRRKKVLDELKDTKGYWKLREEALGALYGDVPLYEATDRS